MTMHTPIIGITVDVADPAEPGQPPRPRAQCALTYARAVVQAGGVPILLAPLVELIPAYLHQCDGFLFTGGDDPRTEPFGVPTHPKATPLHPIRQEFEIALLDALSKREAAPRPVLGVCLGMQLMALHAGGSLNQHMPDDTPTAADHVKNAVHRVMPADAALRAAFPGVPAVPLIEADVTSHHRQAVRDPGRLRVRARAHDGVIEAVDDPARPFYLGVQWHPERTACEPLGPGLIRQFVEACRQQ